VRQGANISVAYFDQMRNALDLDATLEDFISPGSEWIEIGGKRQHVKSYLGDFLFSPARAHSPVRSLSGGERNRLLLARLFARPANVLVLDEPTNDLDIDTLELLEDLLQKYDGTVFLVSHDRTFLDNVVTSTIAFEGEGRWREYEGGVEPERPPRHPACVAEVDAHQRAGRARGVEQGARRQQVALVQHALGQLVGVHAGVDPAKQAGRLGRKGATRLQRQLDAAAARRIEPGADALGMAAQLALLDAVGQRLLQQAGGGQRGQQLGVEQALHQIGGAARKPMRQLGARILAKPLT
jgi:energy-coupling factor transporter ATP-binding protein EcfA2